MLSQTKAKETRPTSPGFISNLWSRNPHSHDDAWDDQVTKSESRPAWSGNRRKEEKHASQARHKHRDNKAAHLGVFDLCLFLEEVAE